MRPDPYGIESNRYLNALKLSFRKAASCYRDAVGSAKKLKASAIRETYLGSEGAP